MLCGTDFREDSPHTPFTTILQCSYLGLTVSFFTYPHKLCRLLYNSLPWGTVWTSLILIVVKILFSKEKKQQLFLISKANVYTSSVMKIVKVPTMKNYLVFIGITTSFIMSYNPTGRKRLPKPRLHCWNTNGYNVEIWLIRKLNSENCKILVFFYFYIFFFN